MSVVKKLILEDAYLNAEYARLDERKAKVEALRQHLYQMQRLSAELWPEGISPNAPSVAAPGQAEHADVHAKAEVAVEFDSASVDSGLIEAPGKTTSPSKIALKKLKKKHKRPTPADRRAAAIAEHRARTSAMPVLQLVSVSEPQLEHIGSVQAAVAALPVSRLGQPKLHLVIEAIVSTLGHASASDVEAYLRALGRELKAADPGKYIAHELSTLAGEGRLQHVGDGVYVVVEASVRAVGS